MRRRLMGLTVLGCLACTHLAPRSSIGDALQHQPDELIVTTRYGDTIVIREPAVVGDSLVGIRVETARHRQERVAVAVRDVEEILEPELSTRRIVVGTLGTTAVLLYLIYALQPET